MCNTTLPRRRGSRPDGARYYKNYCVYFSRLSSCLSDIDDSSEATTDVSSESE